MAVYSYYYGAAPNQGIGVQAQSRELQNLPCQPILSELASMHALSSPDQSSDRLCFLLAADEYTILGMSYTAPPRDTGYNRSAPCSMQYIIPTDQFKTNDYLDYLGDTVNRVSFQKPTTATPAPMNDFPLDKNNYSGNDDPAVFAALVDALVKAALNNRFLLIILPEETKDNYHSTRWTIALAMDLLPLCLRARIHFLTGLPVSEGVTDPRKGLENAFHYGANVVFCSSNHFRQLQSYYGGEYLDMNKPAPAGAFAKHVAHSNSDKIPAFLRAVEQEVEKAFSRGRLTYEGLNKAAESVKAKEAETPQQPVRRYENTSAFGYDRDDDESDTTSVPVRIAIIVCTLLIIVGIAALVCDIFDIIDLPWSNHSDLPPVVYSQESPTDLPADIDDYLPTDAPTDIPEDILDDANG